MTESAHAAPGVASRPDDAHSHDVIANLWEWNWNSVARECTAVLGPKGYGGVQVAPPQDSLSRSGPSPVHPWWEVYQPVSYHLTSRMGTEAQFKTMVSTCRHAGVKVYVDAVINHMTGQGDVSYGGVHYTKYSYAGLYSPANFHKYPTDCPVPPGPGSQNGEIKDFNNYRQVTTCELVSLSDLRTETTYVRDTIAAYLNKLIGYGVSGFRVDAAKHIPVEDLAAIEARLHRTVDGTRPYVALEVFPGGPGKLSPFAFQGQGSLLGFDYAYQIHDAFKSYTDPPGGSITDLEVFGTQSGLLPSNKELVFVENHDTERNGSTLSYKDGATNTIATEFMLAWPHGRPAVYASFAWTNSDDSPPSNPQGFITDTTCGNGQWICTDRVNGVANMVGWHNVVGDAPVANWYDDSVNLIAFSRGHRGWIAVNHEATAQTHTFTTGLPHGTYCDIIHGTAAHGGCTGPTVTVNSHGKATVTVPAQDAVAFDAGDLVRGH
ncbi:MAG: alpha-amylase [Pseudonocardiales bacterium]|nr:MAG: alpha-amylase [Pseudonocardiales bacterium]